MSSIMASFAVLALIVVFIMLILHAKKYDILKFQNDYLYANYKAKNTDYPN